MGNTQVKHTRGPWEDDNTRKYYQKRVIRMNGVIIATLPEVTAGLTGEQLEGNSRLIAAAPDLLSALQDLVQRCDTSELVDGSSLDTAQAHAIITKIDGGE